MRNIYVGVLVTTLILFCIGGQDKESYLYVMAEKENLRAAPNGDKIAEVLQSTKMKVVEEKGKWVKVQVIGWMWKASTTSDKSEIDKLSARQKKEGTKIVGGFVYKNVRFKSSYAGYVDVIGEMTNNSGGSYTMANFTISVYDKNDNLLATGPILIFNFVNGQTKSFDTTIEADYSSISRYKIDFESGL